MPGRNQELGGGGAESRTDQQSRLLSYPKGEQKTIMLDGKHKKA